jgi:uncharacterized protein (DUF433 family)
VRALYQVVTRSSVVRAGAPVFAGTRVPVKALMDHLDKGGDVDAFLARNPTVPRDSVLAACALGLEALVTKVPLDPPATQRSLLPRIDRTGAIVNAEDLSAYHVTGRRVLCPSCRTLVFKSWPEGWDSHAARRCRGLKAGDSATRKAEFKRRYEHLFR